MFHSKFPKRFWEQSILTATHIINRLPTSILVWKPPFERHGNAPKYDQIKTFGCICYATNILPHKSKFEARAYKCIFLGYIHGVKAYKLYDLTNNKIWCSGMSFSMKTSFFISPHLTYTTLSLLHSLNPFQILTHFLIIIFNPHQTYYPYPNNN